LFLYKYIRLIFGSPAGIENDYSNEVVLYIKAMHKKVMREAQRILMFVRFQKTADDIYFAPFEPLYNVLPLSVRHFRDRFSDQKWLIYDLKRNYGFLYDLKEVGKIEMSARDKISSSGKISPEILNDEELFFQELWRKYYDSVNIKERKNLKVHLNFLPKRFWKYLPEKNVLNR
jgi:probable DNA metabolism protein